MKLTAWIRAIRYQFSTPATMSVFVGTSVAWALTGRFDTVVFLLTVVALIANQIALHLSDDFFDFRAGVDSVEPERYNLFAGGSKVLPHRLLSARQIVFAFVLLYSTTIVIGLYLAWQKGWVVMVLGLAGVLSSYWYSAPPMRLSYRGLGELAIGFNFGPTIVLGAFLVQVLPDRGPGGPFTHPSIGGVISLVPAEAMLAALPLGLITFSMIVVQAMADEDEDRTGGKHTLVVRFGRPFVVRLHIAALTATFGVLLAMVIIGATPWLALTLVAVPAAVRSMITFGSGYRDDQLVERAIADFLAYRVHGLVGLGMTSAFMLAGAARASSEEALLVMSATLVITCMPVGVILYRQSPSTAGFARRILHILGLASIAAPVRDVRLARQEYQWHD